MEGGTYSFIYPGLSASDGGQIDPWKKDSLAYPYDSQAQISEEVAQVGSPVPYLDVAYPLTRIFRPFLVVSVHRYYHCLVLFGQLTEAGRHTLKAFSQYEDPPNILDLYLM